MKSSKSIAIGLLAIFAFSLLAPVGMAQQPASFTITNVSLLKQPIQPDVSTEPTTVSWVYEISGQAPFVGQGESKSAVLTWTTPVKCTHDQIIVTGPSTVTIPITTEPANPNVRVERSSEFKLSATTEAPGEQSLSCTFTGQVAAVGQTVGPAAASSGTLPFTVAYYGLIQASSNGRLKEASPQKPISYDITVTNFGNARTQVAFKLGDDSVGSWKPVLPEPLILESKIGGQGGDIQTTTFQINTPYKNGWNNDERTFKVTLTPTSAKTGIAGGNPVEVNVLARVRGVYVPSLEPMIMLGAILGAGLIVRLMREE